MIGRREVIAAAIAATLTTKMASACEVPFPLQDQNFDVLKQERHVSIVKTFFERIDQATSWDEIEQFTAKIVRTGFRWPTPQPTTLLEIKPLGDLVIVHTRAIEETPENACSRLTQVHAYYSFHFDGDQISLMNTISFGRG